MSVLVLSIHLLLLIGGAWIYFNRMCPSKEKRIFIAAFIFKIFCGLLLSYFYLHYFEGGDSLTYFNEAKRIDSYSQENEASFFEIIFDSNHQVFEKSSYKGQPRALLFTKIIYAIYLVTNGSYWLISVYLSLFAFIGFWLFYLTSVKLAFAQRKSLIVALLIWPSVVFWSGGLIKESVSVGIIMLIATTVISFNHGKTTFWKFLFFIGLSYCLFKLKYYYAGVIVPVSVSYSLVSLIGNKSNVVKVNPIVQALLFFATSFLLVLIASHFHYNLRFSNIPDVIVSNYQLFINKSEPGKAVVFNNLEPSYWDLFLNTPKALIAGMFRPSLFDIKNIWSLLSAMENTLLLILVLAQLKNFRNVVKGDFVLTIAAISFCIIMAVFLSFSAPNFGTLVRYKAGFLPFLILIVISGNPIIKGIKKAGIFTRLNF